MKKIVLALATVSLLATAPAHADAGAFIGGLIIGNILTQPRTVYVQPAYPIYAPPPTVYHQAPPVIVYRDRDFGPPQGDPFALQRQCRVESVYNVYGQYLGQQQICN
jgi:hypothetical protein